MATVFGYPHRFIVLSAFTSRDFVEDLCDFVGTIVGNQEGYVFSDDLFRGVAVHVLSAAVPAGNNAVQVFAEDGVFGGINNQGQLGAVFPQLLDGSVIQLFTRSAQFFFDSFAIADVANGAEHDRSLLGGYGAETDFYGEFGAIAASSVELDIGSHAARFRGLGEILAMMVVLMAIVFGHEHFDLLADELVAVVAKKLLRLRIDLNHGSIAIDGDDGVGKGFEEIAGQENVNHGFDFKRGRGPREIRGRSGHKLPFQSIGPNLAGTGLPVKPSGVSEHIWNEILPGRNVIFITSGGDFTHGGCLGGFAKLVVELIGSCQ